MNYFFELYTENPELTILLIIFLLIGSIMFLTLLSFVIIDFKYDVLIPLDKKINKLKKNFVKWKIFKKIVL